MGESFHSIVWEVIGMVDGFGNNTPYPSKLGVGKKKYPIE